MQKRSSLIIKADMLKVIAETGRTGISVIRILHDANVSSNVYKNYIENLVLKGLILRTAEIHKTKIRYRFYITESGLDILLYYMELSKVLNGIESET